MDHGLLVEDAASLRSGTGRPSLPLGVATKCYQVIGIKLNWDDLYAVRTDLGAKVLSGTELPLPSRDPGPVVDVIEEAIDRLDPLGEVNEVGVSLPGNLRPGDSVVRASPYLGWVDVPLVPLVNERTGRRVVLSNDVRALTAAQHWFGAGNGSSCFGVLVAGKGVGCGLVVNDRLLAGYEGHAGLASHFPIREGGPLCRRGHRGCASSYLTNGAIMRSLAVARDAPITKFEECIMLAEDGDEPAVRVLRDACYALGVLTAYTRT